MVFKKGESGNPGGRPVDPTLRDLARTHDAAGITYLASVVASTDDIPHPIRMKAQDMLFDRGHGKPVTMTVNASPKVPPIELIEDKTVDARDDAMRALARVMRFSREEKK